MPAEPRAVQASPAAPTVWRALHFVPALAGVALLVHAAALLAIHQQRGDFTAYAFQSPDADEYVALARGLTFRHEYIQLDRDRQPLTGPDTWRTPGYPAFLAVVIRLASDSPRVLILAQQILAILTVPMLWLVLRRITAQRWAVLGALAWCLDPFRIYYSFWILSETLFCFVLIIACSCWLDFREPEDSPPRFRFRNPQSKTSQALTLGLLASVLVLIRPIALPLPVLALAGVVFGVSVCPSPAEPRRGLGRALSAVLACLLGIAVPLVPWLVRVHSLTGHVAISQQSGASLAYHKVVDVVLWSMGAARERFDPQATADVRDQIDAELQDRWRERFGALSPAAARSLTWKKLNFGKPLDPGVDPIVASDMLWSIGTDTLKARPAATVTCFTVQGGLMLIFPLGLTIWPPTSAGSAPLSMIFGEHSALSMPVSIVLGGAYGVLALWVLARLVIALVRRRFPLGFFAFWPAAAMFALSLPFEDPRFRLPLIPLFIIMALASYPRRIGT